MVSFSLISDVHAEMKEPLLPPVPAPEPSAETLILAGDIGRASDGSLSNYFRRCAEAGWDDILYVAGNHDVWGLEGDLAARYETLRSVCADAGIRMLQQDVVETKRSKARVAGCTLWSDFGEAIMHVSSMNDYNPFVGGLEPKDTLAQHYSDRKWLGSVVHDVDLVVTHHCPFREGGHGDDLDPFFRTDMSSVWKDADLWWAYGHTHEQVVCSKGATSFITNAVGYADEAVHKTWGPTKFSFDRTVHDGGKVIEKTV